MKNTSIAVALSLVLISCSSNRTETKNPTQEHFGQFLKKFRRLPLPLTFDFAKVLDDTNGLPEFDEKSIDTLYLAKDDNPQTAYYGMLPDTSNFYALIFQLNGTQGEPLALKTYDKFGKVIDELFLGYACLDSPFIESCNSSRTINVDFTIQMTDTLQTAEVDSESKPIDSTRLFYALYSKGKIGGDGKITMDPETRKDLTERK